jgi:hypothetical protein
MMRAGFFRPAGEQKKTPFPAASSRRVGGCFSKRGKTHLWE